MFGTSASLWNRSVNQLDPRPRRSESFADANPRDEETANWLICNGVRGRTHKRAASCKMTTDCGNPLKLTHLLTQLHIRHFDEGGDDHKDVIKSVIYGHRRDGEIGRRSGLKIRRGQKPCGGSIPPPGTTYLVTVNSSSSGQRCEKWPQPTGPPNRA